MGMRLVITQPICVLVLLAAVLLGTLKQNWGDRAGRSSLTFLGADLHIETSDRIEQALRLRGQATAAGRYGDATGVHHVHSTGSTNTATRRSIRGVAVKR